MKELGMTTIGIDGSVKHETLTSLPERYDLTREIGSKIIDEMPFFTEFNGKPAKAFRSVFNATVNEQATNAFIKQYEAKYHSKPHAKLYGTVVIVTGALEDLAEINYEL